MRNRTYSRLPVVLTLAGAILGPAALVAQQSEVVGNAARGEPLFADTYNCYACHGFDAQTGERRLLPMRYTQQAFIIFVQNSPLPNMPAFPDVPAQDLADIYAYIQSIPVDAPEVDSLPLLRDLRERKLTALEN
jgi:mono/diheme cytochrome c family protein